MMFTRSVATFPAASAWLDRAYSAKQVILNKEEGDAIGAQRALVLEECPKCKNPRMYFWTQQLRSADEGQTVFYECPKCDHRYSVNS
jgi:DNA-directed RNA polymerase subunit M/transcription elongation factor TFIIS